MRPSRSMLKFKVKPKTPQNTQKHYRRGPMKGGWGRKWWAGEWQTLTNCHLFSEQPWRFCSLKEWQFGYRWPTSSSRTHPSPPHPPSTPTPPPHLLSPHPSHQIRGVYNLDNHLNFNIQMPNICSSSCFYRSTYIGGLSHIRQYLDLENSIAVLQIFSLINNLNYF